MSKPSNPRREADNEAKAVLRTVRVSPRKLDLVAATIRGKKAASAVNELTFSKKRIARDVKKALNSAIANAENNHNLDVDRLIVAEASVGKGLVMKRFQTRGRGRAAGIIKPFSHLTIVVRERAEAEDKEWVRRLIPSASGSTSTAPGTPGGTPRAENTPRCSMRTSTSARCCASAWLRRAWPRSSSSVRPRAPASPSTRPARARGS